MVESKIVHTFASLKQNNNCPGGGIGRRVGLKHQWSNILAGSIPAWGTKAMNFGSLLFFYNLSEFVHGSHLGTPNILIF